MLLHVARRVGSRPAVCSTTSSRSRGHSLGQVTALIASGVLDLDDGVRFAARRAELTQAAADAHPGRMAALLGATIEQAEAACAAAPDACWVANDNAPGQVVIAGTPDGVDAAIARGKELGVRRAMPLNVGGAFHTPLMNVRARRARRRARRRVVRDAARDRSSRTTTATAYDDADGWRNASPTRHGAGALAHVDGDARRARRATRSSKSATAR